MRITLEYGTTGLDVRLPDESLAGVLTLRPHPPLADAPAAIAAALAAPVAAPPLAELAQGRRSACVVISDITRPVPNQL
jgi:lactate racemase